MPYGPTIAVACGEALKKGATVKKTLDVIKNVAKLGKPVVVISNMNPIYNPAFRNSWTQYGNAAPPLLSSPTARSTRTKAGRSFRHVKLRASRWFLLSLQEFRKRGLRRSQKMHPVSGMLLLKHIPGARPASRIGPRALGAASYSNSVSVRNAQGDGDLRSASPGAAGAPQ